MIFRNYETDFKIKVWSFTIKSQIYYRVLRNEKIRSNVLFLCQKGGSTEIVTEGNPFGHMFNIASFMAERRKQSQAKKKVDWKSVLFLFFFDNKDIFSDPRLT